MTSLSDDVLGRARVRATAELEAYYGKLAQLEAGALWTVPDAGVAADALALHGAAHPR